MGICIYVYMYICMCEYMDVCMYFCICVDIIICLLIFVCMYIQVSKVHVRTFIFEEFVFIILFNYMYVL